MATKIMLVEDDTNLSEIYAARLQAEGYQIISAKDGEEALALAVKEHPELILSDVMMPKISGFDMLDILRGTEGVKNIKVIMMTALGQAEDKARAEKLGVDRYLVKSQVTLEDVIKAVKDVLEESGSPAIPAAGVSSSVTTDQPADTSTPVPAKPTIVPVVAAPPSTPHATNPAAPATAKSSDDEESAVLNQIQQFLDTEEKSASGKADAPDPSPKPPAQPTAASAAPTPDDPDKLLEDAPKFNPDADQDDDSQTADPPKDDSSSAAGERVIKPLNDITKGPDLDKLLSQENEKELSTLSAGTSGTSASEAGSANQPGSMIQPNTDSQTGDPNRIAL